MGTGRACRRPQTQLGDVGTFHPALVVYVPASSHTPEFPPTTVGSVHAGCALTESGVEVQTIVIGIVCRQIITEILYSLLRPFGLGIFQILPGKDNVGHLVARKAFCLLQIGGRLFARQIKTCIDKNVMHTQEILVILYVELTAQGMLFAVFQVVAPLFRQTVGTVGGEFQMIRRIKLVAPAALFCKSETGCSLQAGHDKPL